MNMYDEGRDSALQTLGLTANDFASMVQDDETQATEKQKYTGNSYNKTPAWSGASSLEGGDAGTRNEQMGLPRFSGA